MIFPTQAHTGLHCARVERTCRVAAHSFINEAAPGEPPPHTPPPGALARLCRCPLHAPCRPEAYTCWSQASGARCNNYGTRIDLILAGGPGPGPGAGPGAGPASGPAGSVEEAWQASAAVAGAVMGPTATAGGSTHVPSVAAWVLDGVSESWLRGLACLVRHLLLACMAGACAHHHPPLDLSSITAEPTAPHPPTHPFRPFPRPATPWPWAPACPVLSCPALRTSGPSCRAPTTRPPGRICGCRQRSCPRSTSRPPSAPSTSSQARTPARAHPAVNAAVPAAVASAPCVE